MGTLSEQLGRLVYIDSNIVIYIIEGFAKHAPAIQALLAALERGELRLATSELTVAEVLVKPLQLKSRSLQDTYLSFLESTSELQVAAVTRSVLLNAARLRAASALKLPDAIHIATALELGCDAFLTNDTLLRNVPAIPTKLLSELRVS